MIFFYGVNVRMAGVLKKVCVPEDERKIKNAEDGT